LGSPRKKIVGAAALALWAEAAPEWGGHPSIATAIAASADEGGRIAASLQRRIEAADLKVESQRLRMEELGEGSRLWKEAANLKESLEVLVETVRDVALLNRGGEGVLSLLSPGSMPRILVWAYHQRLKEVSLVGNALCDGRSHDGFGVDKWRSFDAKDRSLHLNSSDALSLSLATLEEERMGNPAANTASAAAAGGKRASVKKAKKKKSGEYTNDMFGALLFYRIFEAHRSVTRQISMTPSTAFFLILSSLPSLSGSPQSSFRSLFSFLHPPLTAVSYHPSFFATPPYLLPLSVTVCLWSLFFRRFRLFRSSQQSVSIFSRPSLSGVI